MSINYFKRITNEKDIQHNLSNLYRAMDSTQNIQSKARTTTSYKRLLQNTKDLIMAILEILLAVSCAVYLYKNLGSEAKDLIQKYDNKSNEKDK